MAADVLLIGRDRIRANQTYAGGSCGNVLSILAFLNWKSYPIVRLGGDRRASAVLADLKAFNVQTTFISNGTGGVTPAIVVRITRGSDGETKAKFEWKDPSSGAWLPRYRPLPKRTAEQLRSQLPNANVFYFDRAEPSSLILAKELKSKGAIIFFEPSSAKLGDKIFHECLAVADILKYSHDRIPVPVGGENEGPSLEIQTLGETGLRFRRRGPGCKSQWTTLHAINAIKGDPTGCGDWCSAGVIERVCDGGREKFESLSDSSVISALTFGQALASVNVCFEGARGPMYHLTPEEIRVKADAIILGAQVAISQCDRIVTEPLKACQ